MNLEESIEMTIKGCGVELYDIVTAKENERDIYRVYISSNDGISLDKCAEVSRLISPILDVDEPMRGKYTLEVSSPGIERKLKKPRHFISSIGALVKVKDFDKNIIQGKLIDANANDITLLIEDSEKAISYSEISSASTYYEW